MGQAGLAYRTRDKNQTGLGTDQEKIGDTDRIKDRKKRTCNGGNDGLQSVK